MTKKVLLIAIFIISLLLIGLMLLVVDRRSDAILNDFNTLEEKFQEQNASQEEVKITPEKLPEVIQQFNAISEQLVQYIEELKDDFKVDGDFEKMEAEKNEIFFVNNTNTYSEKGKQFLEHIEAYENILAVVHLEFPKTKTTSSKLRSIDANQDWLVYNFKGFPSIAVYTKLVAMEATIERKRKDIITLLLSK